MFGLGDLVAAYAAILATVLAIRQARRERRPLHLSLEPSGPGGPDDDEAYIDAEGEGLLRVRVVNRGGAPITIEEFGLRYVLDCRRVPNELLLSSGAWGKAVAEGPIRLDVFEKADGYVGQRQILDELHGAPPTLQHVDEGESWVEWWDGSVPARLDGLYARDVAGREYIQPLDSFWRRFGYESFDRGVQPIVRNQISAVWLRACLGLWESQRYGRTGTRALGLLHRLRLFPAPVPDA